MSPDPERRDATDAAFDAERDEREALARELAWLDLVPVAVDVSGELLSLHKPRSAESLIDSEEFARDERLPYWADIWPSSRALGGVLRGLSPTADTTLLELGSGVGLVAVAALRAGFRVTATDYYDDALRTTRYNALLHTDGAAAHLTTRHVDWRAFPDDLGRFDVVCAADVLYEREYADLVAQAVARTLADTGTAWIADPGRIAWPAFDSAMRGVGLEERERLVVLVQPDPEAGDLATAARPGETTATPDARRDDASTPRRLPAHRVTVTGWRWRSAPAPDQSGSAR